MFLIFIQLFQALENLANHSSLQSDPIGKWNIQKEFQMSSVGFLVLISGEVETGQQVIFRLPKPMVGTKFDWNLYDMFEGAD